MMISSWFPHAFLMISSDVLMLVWVVPPRMLVWLGPERERFLTIQRNPIIFQVLARSWQCLGKVLLVPPLMLVWLVPLPMLVWLVPPPILVWLVHPCMLVWLVPPRMLVRLAPPLMLVWLVPPLMLVWLVPPLMLVWLVPPLMLVWLVLLLFWCGWCLSYVGVAGSTFLSKTRIISKTLKACKTLLTPGMSDASPHPGCLLTGHHCLVIGMSRIQIPLRVSIGGQVWCQQPR